MQNQKEIEQLANELAKAHGSIDALTAALAGVLQVMRNDSSLTAAVVENMKLHRSFQEGFSENSPFIQGFQRTQTYVSEILENSGQRRELRRHHS